MTIAEVHLETLKDPVMNKLHELTTNGWEDHVIGKLRSYLISKKN